MSTEKKNKKATNIKKSETNLILSPAEELKKLDVLKLEIEAHQQLLIRKGLESDSPTEIVAANNALQNIAERDNQSKKSFLFDPNEYITSFGYKDKPYALTYLTLHKMSKVEVINSIFKTRKNQITGFAEPQSDKYSTGFVIRKKQRFGINQNAEQKLTTQEQREIEYITEFILNCGDAKSNWMNDDFNEFLRKWYEDSLKYDQATFEIVRNRKGVPTRFFATDGSTYRISDSYDDEEYKRYIEQYKLKNRPIKGYYPSYVQILDGKIEAEFYPWELCFGIRNPNSSIYNHGYGVSELEELITTITSFIYGNEYNSNQFTQGSFPKGLLRIKSGNSAAVEQFKQQFTSMIGRGARTAWKTPVVEGDSVEWIDLEKRGRDFEYSKWIEFLIKFSCAIYTIDPAEINFPLSGGSTDSNPLFGQNNESRIKFSRDKGLYPLLNFGKRKLNKFLVSQFFDNKYELAFVGMDGLTVKDELEMDIKKVGSFMKINEARKKWGLEEDPDADIIGNSVYMQNKQMKLQQQMMEQQNEQQQNAENPEQQDEEVNPFMKDFEDYLNKLDKES